MASLKARVTGVACGLLAAGSLLAGCGGQSGGPADVAKAAGIPFENTMPKATAPVDTVNWMIDQEPTSLDPDIAGSNALYTVLANVCQSVMQLQPDGSDVPLLAKSARWVDSKTLVLTIRGDARFHDGTPVTAADVLWSMQRHAKPSAWKASAYTFVTGMSLRGGDQVVVRFKQPDAGFLPALASTAGIVYEPSVVEKEGKDFGQPGHADACSGPYSISDWTPGQKIVLTAESDYWNKDVTLLTHRLAFTWGAASAMTNALKTGQADGAYLSSPDSAIPLLHNDTVKVYQGPSTTVWSLVPTDRGSAVKVQLRRALSLAIDRQGIAAAAFGGLAQPAKAPVGNGAWGYSRSAFQAAYAKLADVPAKPSSDDLAAARKLVEGLGSTPSLIVATDGTSADNVIAAAVVAAGKSIGVSVRVKTVPASQYGNFLTSEALRRTVDFFPIDWYISQADPLGFYKNGAADGFANAWTGFTDPTYDRLYAEAEATLDPTKRARLAIQLQQRWTDNMLWVPLVAAPNTMALSSKLTGATVSGSFIFYPWATSLGSAS